MAFVHVFFDFTKAFEYGVVDRDMFVELRDEDGRNHPRVVGRLKKAMYGLREAPLIWQRVVQQVLKDMGFRALVTAQCIYFTRAIAWWS